MSREKTDMDAAASRPRAEVPVGRSAKRTTTTTTVTLEFRTWAALKGWLAEATADVGHPVKIGPVGNALYELLLEDPALQKRVTDRLK